MPHAPLLPTPRAATGEDPDWVVVGAGLTGACFARRLTETTGARVLVVDRRDHVGGNTHDAPDADGTLVHQYGPHIFHTGSARVFDFLSRFTGWTPYVHRVLAEIDGRLLPVPYNFTTLRALLPADAPAIERALLAAHPEGARVPVLSLGDSPDPLLRDFGAHVVEKVFRHYSAKQWGRPLESLDASVSGRVPVVVGFDDRYFRDAYQGIPDAGYTAMVSGVLDAPGITVALDEDGRAAAARFPRARVLWTGEVDAYFDHAHGHLPYRSLEFTHTRVTDGRQPVAQVNYPDTRPETRTVEHAHFALRADGPTTRSREVPVDHVPGVTVPYYPVPGPDSAVLHARYADLAAAEAPRVLFAGRLADYRYYDMHQAVGRGLTLADAVADGRPDPHTAAADARRVLAGAGA